MPGPRVRRSRRHLHAAQQLAGKRVVVIGSERAVEVASAGSTVVVVDLDWADDGSVSATLRGKADFDDGE